MPTPNASDLHVNALLTDVSVGYVQDQTKFVAQSVFPPINVLKQSNRVAVYDIGDFYRDDMEIRLPGTESAGSGFRTSNSTVYTCDTYALHKDVSDDEKANADQPYDLARDAAIFLAQKAIIKQEVDFATNFFTTNVWTTDRVGGTDFTVWSDVSSSPIEYLETQCQVIEGRTGYWPTDLTLNRAAWGTLKNHPDVVDRIKGAAGPGNPAIVNRQSVAALLELERINVSAAVRNTAQETATNSISYIMGNHALLTYRPASPSLMVPSAGYTFRWTGRAGSVDGMTISTMRLDWLKSDRHEIEANFDQKKIAADLGVFLSGVA